MASSANGVPHHFVHNAVETSVQNSVKASLANPTPRTIPLSTRALLLTINTAVTVCDPAFLGLLTYTLFAFLGTGFSPFFFCTHLLEFALYIPPLRFVLSGNLFVYRYERTCTCVISLSCQSQLECILVLLSNSFLVSNSDFTSRVSRSESCS